MKMGRNADEKITGVLHDVIEDSSWAFGDIQAEGFSTEIIAALVCLTKISETEDYDNFIECVAKNPLAVTVKIHDPTDNMDVRRLPHIGDGEMIRLNKYLKAYHRLKPDYDAPHPLFDEIR